MANNSGKNGLWPARTKTGKLTGNANEYEMLANEGNATFLGDPVSLLATSSALDGCPDVALFAPGGSAQALLCAGPMVAVKPTLTNLTLQYRLASTLTRILVHDDPAAIFTIRADGTAAGTDVNKYAGFEIIAGNTTTGVTGTLLDSSDISASATVERTMMILRAQPAIGNPLATSAVTIYEVILVNHALQQNSNTTALTL